jgi:hypothetical protein
MAAICWPFVFCAVEAEDIAGGEKWRQTASWSPSERHQVTKPNQIAGMQSQTKPNQHYKYKNPYFNTCPKGTVAP